MILTTKISDLSTKQIKLLNTCLEQACTDIMGKRQNINLKISVRKTSNTLGYYDPDTKIICIYKKNIKNINEWVKVFIHEWQHSLQKKLKRKYAKYDYKFGYRKNPFEIEARESEKLFKSIVWSFTKHLLKDIQ